MPLKKTSKEEIIRSSIKTFREKGYYRTTMADLSKNAGLTKGAFYYHFTNKEDVMLKSLESLHQWFSNRIFSYAYNEDLSHKERILKMADVIQNAFSKNAGGCFFANTILETVPVEDTFKKELDSFFKEWEEAFTNLLKANKNEKEAISMAKKLIADIEGSIIFMQLRNDKTYLKNALERVINEV